MSTPTLRPYQLDIIDKARALITRGVKSFLITAPTGSGKTILTAYMLRSAAKKGWRCWFINHRRELITQSSDSLGTVGVHHGIIANTFSAEPEQLVQVCSIGTLIRRYDKVLPPDLIIWDECFPSGTLVGATPIELVRVGDMVPAWDEVSQSLCLGRVVRVFSKKYRGPLIKIKTKGSVVTCTPEHPFLICGKGWVAAKEIKKGDVAYGLCGVWGSNFQGQGGQVPWVLSGNNGRQEQERRPKKNEGEQPDEKRSSKGEGVGGFKENEAQAENTRGERQAASNTTKKTGRRLKVENRVCGPVWVWSLIKGFTKSLQNRYCKPKNENSNRSGRPVPPMPKGESERQKERGFLSLVRVESVSVYEQRGYDGVKGLCPDGKVYNLEVERYHTYIANGLVVHNCHHLSANTWASVFSSFPAAIHIGLTATPERLDGRGLNKFFKELILGPSVDTLIKDKFLSPYDMFAPQDIDFSKVASRMGDYAREEINKIMNNPQVVGNAVDEYRKKALGKRAVAFCTSIAHSKYTAELFNFAGVPAEHLDGTTPVKRRDQIIKDFKEGKIKVLSNVDLVGEGFDLPALEVAILLRPTKSLGLYLQQVGRALRVYPGKEKALIFDHVRNCLHHGLPDDERDWHLEGRDKREKKEPSVTICTKCFAINKSTDRVCKICGQKLFMKAPPKPIAEVSGTLDEIDKDKFRQQQQKNKLKHERNKKIWACRTLEDFQRVEMELNYKSGWAFHRWAYYKEKNGIR